MTKRIRSTNERSGLSSHILFFEICVESYSKKCSVCEKKDSTILGTFLLDCLERALALVYQGVRAAIPKHRRLESFNNQIIFFSCLFILEVQDCSVAGLVPPEVLLAFDSSAMCVFVLLSSFEDTIHMIELRPTLMISS